MKENKHLTCVFVHQEKKGLINTNQPIHLIVQFPINIVLRNVRSWNFINFDLQYEHSPCRRGPISTRTYHQTFLGKDSKSEIFLLITNHKLKYFM